DELAVDGVLHLPLDGDGDGLVHLGGDDQADALLARVAGLGRGFVDFSHSGYVERSASVCHSLGEPAPHQLRVRDRAVRARRAQAWAASACFCFRMVFSRAMSRRIVRRMSGLSSPVTAFWKVSRESSRS